MSGTLHVIHPNRVPFIQGDHFENDPGLRKQWRDGLDPKSRFLTERYWRFKNDPKAEAADAVGKLMLGIAVHYPEFQGVGNSVLKGETLAQDEVLEGITCFTLTVAVSSRVLHPERTATNLIEATNEQLLALNSPYHFPLDYVESK